MELFDIYSGNDIDDSMLHMFSLYPIQGKRPFIRHQHSFFEIGYFESGSGEYTTDTKTYFFSAGDIFVFSCNEIHKITCINEPTILINLHFEPRILSDKCDFLLQQGPDFFFHHNISFENRIPASNDQNKLIQSLLLDIKNELMQRKPAYQSIIVARLTEILVLLIREYHYNASLPTATATHQYLIQAIDYIQTHFSGKIFLEEIAEAANISPSYLSALFHKQMGRSIWDYVTEKRLNKALYLLKASPKLSVLDVAFQCGFNNTATFNRAFKHYFQITPREYRKGEETLLRLPNIASDIAFYTISEAILYPNINSIFYLRY